MASMPLRHTRHPSARTALLVDHGDDPELTTLAAENDWLVQPSRNLA